jgi:hypothetical protein
MPEPVNMSTIISSTAFREAAGRDMALSRALGGPAAKPLELPVLRQPVLPANFQERVDELDKKIYGRGVAISRERILSLGRSRFTELLAKDRVARSMQRVIGTKADVTSWSAVLYAFACANGLTTMVPKLKTAEVYAGSGLDREEAARIDGFDDLWKSGELETARNVLVFHDAFRSMVLGVSLLERLADDGRLRSYSLCGTKGPKADLFTDWLPALQGAHFTVKLNDPLWHTTAWLSGEQSLQPSPMELARDLFRVRAPSLAQIKLAHAVLHGFLLGYSGWSLWNYVGRATRKAMVQTELEEWKSELAVRYPKVQAFNHALRAAFNRQVSGTDYDQVFQFDGAAHRSFIDRSVQKLMNQLSGLLALILEKTFPETCVVRFQNLLVCEAKAGTKAANWPKNFLDCPLGEKLEAAFPGQRFYDRAFTIKELPA